MNFQIAHIYFLEGQHAIVIHWLDLTLTGRTWTTGIGFRLGTFNVHIMRGFVILIHESIHTDEEAPNSNQAKHSQFETIK